MFISVPVSAASTPYSTYTYDINGNIQLSPPAYAPDKEVTNFDMNMDTPLSSPEDIFVDGNKNIYIADTGNKRVVVCDPDFLFKFEITTFTNEHGVPDALDNPCGLCVTDKNIYVCDSSKCRVVVFDLDGNFDRIIYAPEADVLGNDTSFTPVSIGVDKTGRMYIVSSQTYSGIFSYSEDGEFESFIGVQKANVSWIVQLRKKLFPNAVMEDNLTMGYLSLVVDNDGFVWATVDTSQDEDTFMSAIHGNDESFAPIKRLNVSGKDVMVRSGFFMPAGEISAFGFGDDSVTDSVSILSDIALGPNGMWTVIDTLRSKVYAYDANGVLLFVFGDKGAQLGNLKDAVAIDFYGSDIYVLDRTLNSVTIYKREEYGDAINMALEDDINRNFSAALDDWQEILKRNNNCDSAYVGVGQNLVKNGQYKLALEYYKNAADVEHYSTAYKQVRKEWCNKYILIVPVVVVVLCFGLSKFIKYASRKNKIGMTKVGKRTFGEEIIYGFYLILHPFDGFWDIKHEKRGSVRGGLFWIAMACLALIYQQVGTAWMKNPDKDHVNVFFAICTVIVPLVLWIVGNWCLTTLFDGEGSLKDIFIATSYSLVPLVILVIPATALSNILSLDEMAVSTLICTVSYVWLGFLVFFGTMTTHGYSMGKNFIMTLATVLGMCFIMFLAMLFSNLVTRMVSFVTEIITELGYRAQ